MSGVLDKQMDADLARGCFKKIVNPGDALGLFIQGLASTVYHMRM